MSESVSEADLDTDTAFFGTSDTDSDMDRVMTSDTDTGSDTHMSENLGHDLVGPGFINFSRSWSVPVLYF